METLPCLSDRKPHQGTKFAVFSDLLLFIYLMCFLQWGFKSKCRDTTHWKGDQAQPSPDSPLFFKDGICTQKDEKNVCEASKGPVEWCMNKETNPFLLQLSEFWPKKGSRAHSSGIWGNLSCIKRALGSNILCKVSWWCSHLFCLLTSEMNLLICSLPFLVLGPSLQVITSG